METFRIGALDFSTLEDDACKSVEKKKRERENSVIKIMIREATVLILGSTVAQG
jgi:hypothetical protein